MQSKRKRIASVLYIIYKKNTQGVSVESGRKHISFYNYLFHSKMNIVWKMFLYFDRGIWRTILVNIIATYFDNCFNSAPETQACLRQDLPAKDALIMAFSDVTLGCWDLLEFIQSRSIRSNLVDLNLGC